MASTQAAPPGRFTVTAFAVTIILLHVALRLPHLGHLLTWDEAMNLLSVRALVAGGHDFYSFWFWRHPPAYSVLMAALQPLADGFALRAEALSLLLSLGVQGALFAVTRLAFGLRAGLLACACYALMPGAIFFDVWIKQDVLLALFGLAALGCWLRGRILWSGLLLGLACLTKENAVFFGGALFLLWCFTKPRRGRDLAALLLVPVFVAGWWFVYFSISLHQIFGFVLNLGDASAAEWSQPWWFFFAKLPLDLGWPGLALALLGGVALALVLRRGESAGTGWLWPLALLAPGYLLLTLMHGKVAWLNIALLPAFAALQGLALDELARRVRLTPAVPWLAALLLLAVPALRLNYESYLQRQDAGAWRGAHASRAAAQELDRRAQPGGRVLLTPMWYWSGEQAAPCPIFLCYARPYEFLLRPNTADADAIERDIRQHRLAWAVLPPPPGAGEEKLLAPLIRRHQLQPVLIGGGMSCLLDVRSLHASPTPLASAPPSR
jgi:4-amino-4-deoxy-L-arabinose transferase-like glycosyltransferase